MNLQTFLLQLMILQGILVTTNDFTRNFSYNLVKCYEFKNISVPTNDFTKISVTTNDFTKNFSYN